MLSDGASYMIKAGKVLLVLYPNMIHVTCVAHTLHRGAEAAREQSLELNQSISSVGKSSPNNLNECSSRKNVV